MSVSHCGRSVLALTCLFSACGLASAEGERSFLGINLRALSPEVAAELEVTATEGLIVVSTHVGSPARVAGVLPLDLLLEVNGQATPTQEAFQAAMAPLHVGDEVKLAVSRKAERVELTARLVSRKDWEAEWVLEGKPLPELAVSAWNRPGPGSVEELRGSVTLLVFWYIT
ncbi:MAG: PDZ domain-containing protein [Planctomycetota bacterium]